jgi:tetratricopeptide (TPR) repeat protein
MSNSKSKNNKSTASAATGALTAEAWCAKGNELFATQKIQAIAAYDRAISLKPDYADAYNNKGVALDELNRNEEAIAAYDRAISLKPDYANAYCNKGIALNALNRKEEAIAAYDRAISLKPDYANAYCNKGIALDELNRNEEAIAAYDRAISLKPDYANAYCNKGIALNALNRKEEAIAAYDRAISLKPDYANAYCNKGIALIELNRNEEAIEAYDNAISLKPDYATAYCKKGNALNALNRKEEAIAAYDRFISLKPDDATAYCKKGNALNALNRKEEAIAAYDRAISLKPDDADAYNNKGLVLNALNRNEEAIAAYDRAISLKPDDATAYCKKGNALNALNRKEEAIAAYDRAISLKPDDADAYNNKGLVLNALNRNEEAIAAYDRAISLKPDDATAYSNKGIALNELNRNEEAIAAYDRAISLKPDDATAYSNKGVALNDLNRNEEAIAAYDRAISLKPDDATAYSNKGVALNDLNRNEEAIAAYDRAISLKPDFAIAYNNKGLVLNALNRNEEAIAAYDRAISLKPDDADAYCNKGIALNDLNRNEEAIAAYDRFISLKPDDTTAYFNKGLVLNALNRNEEAIEAYDNAISLKPDDADAYFNKGIALIELNRNEEAIEAYDNAISLKPDDATAYCKKGNALNALNRKEEAIAAYDRAISLKPDDADAYNNKGLVLNALNRNEEAIAAYDRAISLKPDDATAYCKKGNALNALNRKEEAIAAYDRAISLKPDDADAYNNKGLVLNALNRNEEAIAAYDRAISLKPDDADAYNNKGLVLNALNRNEEAIAAYDRAISLKPDFAIAYNSKGNALNALNRKEEAIAAYDRAISLKPDYALCYCSKGKVLQALGREAEALNCLNKAYEISQSGNLGKNLSTSNVDYINRIVSQDREALLLKLKTLQEASIETQAVVHTLDASNPIVKSAVDKFKALKQAKIEITDRAIDSLDDKKINKDQTIAHADNQSLLEQLTIQTNLMLQMQAQMLQLQAEAKQLKDRVDIHDIVLEDHGSRINLTEDTLTKLASDLGITKEEIKANKEEFQALASLVATHDHRIKASEDYLTQMGDVTGTFDQIKEQIAQNSHQFAGSLDEQNRKLEKLSTEVGNLSALSSEVMSLTDRVNAQEDRLIEVYQRFDEYDKKLVSLDSIVGAINVNNEAIQQLQGEMLSNKRTLDQFNSNGGRGGGKGSFSNDDLVALSESLNAKMLETNQNIRLLQKKVTEQETTLESVANLVPQLKDLLLREEQSQKAEAELAAIFADPYKGSFYEVMRWELNTVYLAAMVVQTDIVKSSKSGSVGKIGKLISSISSHIPMVGAGVNLLGYILGSVDVIHQKTIIARYASLAIDAVEMSNLAKLISQSLVSNDLIKNSSDRGHSTTVFSKFTQILGDIAIEFGQNGLSNVASKISYVETSSFIVGQAGKKEVISEDKQAVISSSASSLKGMSADNITMTVGQTVIDDTIHDLYAKASLNDKQSFKGRCKKLNPFKNNKKGEEASRKAEGSKEGTATIMIQQEDQMSPIIRQEVLSGEKDAIEISRLIIAKIFKEGPGGGSISSKANYIIRFVKAEYGLIIEDDTITNMSTDIDSMSIGSPLSAVRTSPIKSEQTKKLLLETSSNEIAIGVIARAKTLMKATNTNSHTDAGSIARTTTEQEFITEIAKILRTEYRGLLESSNLSEDLRGDLIKQLILGFKNNGTFAVNSGIFEINDTFMLDEELLSGVIATAKDKLTTKEYLTTEEQVIEIRHLSSIVYDNPLLNETKLLLAAKSTNNIKIMNDLINLGQDQELAIELIEAAQEYGPLHIISTIFGKDPSTAAKTEQAPLNTNIDTDVIASYEQLDSSQLVGES